MLKPQKIVVLIALRGFALKQSRSGLIRKLLEQGYRIALITTDDQFSRSLVNKDVELHVVPFSHGRISLIGDLHASLMLYKKLIEIKSELVVTFGLKASALASPFLRAHQGAVFSLAVVTGLGRAFSPKKSGLIRIVSFLCRHLLSLFEYRIWQNPDDMAQLGFVSTSSDNKDHLVVSSGVDLDLFTRFSEYGKSTRSNFQILMVGRAIPLKGIYDFVKVAENIYPERKDIIFRWAGEIPESVRLPILGPNVQFLGFLERSELLQVYEQSDLLFFPSQYREGVPRAILEASAMGIPTIAYNLPGTREAVRHEITGYLVEPNCLDSCLDRILHLYHNDMIRTKLAQAARLLVLREFDVAEIEDRYVSIVNRIFANRLKHERKVSVS